MALRGSAITGWLRKPQDGEAVVVFVHGIVSDGIRCWMSGDGKYWPALLAAEPTLQNVGIFIFSYKTSAFSKTFSVGDIVDNLKEELRLEKIIDCRRVIFVCHSMGGIVARRYLVAQQAELIERKTQIGLFLVATPSLGSVQANLLFPLLGLLKHSQAKVLRFHQQNVWLNDLDKDFINLYDSRRLSIRGKELVEDVPIEIARWRIFSVTLGHQTVPPYSAAKYFKDSVKVTDSSHITICKPTTASAFQHRLLIEFVSELTAAPIAPVTFSVPLGWTFVGVARELVNLDRNGGVLICDKLTQEEQGAALIEKRLVASSIAEALEMLRHLATPKIREYRIELVGREYRLIPN